MNRRDRQHGEDGQDNKLIDSTGAGTVLPRKTWHGDLLCLDRWTRERQQVSIMLSECWTNRYPDADSSC